MTEEEIRQDERFKIVFGIEWVQHMAVKNNQVSEFDLANTVATIRNLIAQKGHHDVFEAVLFDRDTSAAEALKAEYQKLEENIMIEHMN